MPRISDELLEYLGRFITANKRARIQDALDLRTRWICIALEDIYQPHNASACLRTAECLGVQDVHIIEKRNSYTLNPDVARGASKWLSLHRYREPGADNTTQCLNALRERGYRLVATTPGEEACGLDDLPLDQPVALLFGTEEIGLSDVALSAADLRLRLPMFGFTQSYNISVSAAITLSHLIKRLHASEAPWGLPEEQRRELQLEWYRKLVRRDDLFEARFREELQRIESEQSATESAQRAAAEELRGQDRPEAESGTDGDEAN